MPTLSRSHYLYLQSKHRNSGTPSNYSIKLPPSLIQCDEEFERIRVTIMNFNVYNSWYMINAGFNTINFYNMVTNTTTSVSIPGGSYSYYRLAAEINNLYADCTCTWLQDSNKMCFTFTDSHQMSFDGIYNILGFQQGEQPEGTTIVSSQTMIPVPTTGILINLINQMPYHGAINLDNLTGFMRPSTVLARVGINASPFQLITYSNVTENDNGIYISTNNLNELEFLFTTPDQVEMTYLPDHDLLIKVEVWAVDDESNMQTLMEDISAIKQTLSDLFLMKHLEQS